MERNDEAARELVRKMEALASVDDRYSADAFLFVIEAVAHAVETAGEVRHVTGRELCGGARDLARSRFGPMAKEVLNFWGLRTTEDIGSVVFRLVEAGELGVTEDDSIGDFVAVFEFDEAFERDYFGRE